MTVPSKTWDQFTSDMIASWGAGMGVSPVLSPGDFLLALFEAVSGQLEFMQAQVFLVLALTRAQSSTGADLDSFFAQFSFPRLPATFATGPVVLGKLQPSTSPIVVPAATLTGGVFVGGLLVQTVGGGATYQVVPDATQSTYSAQSNSYIMPAGASSVIVTVQSVVGGAAGNVAAGAIEQLASQTSLDTVVNQLNLANGFDAESDDDYHARFVQYLATLAKATKSAIQAAAQSVQQGIEVALVENQTPDGQTLLGTFTAFIDNGGQLPTASLLALVFAAVDATRAFGVQAFVVASQIQLATVVVTVRPAAGATLAALQGPVAAAIVAISDALTAGQTLFVSAVEAAALSVPGVMAVRPGTLINGVNVDLVPSTISEVQVTLSGVLVGQY